MKAPQKYNHILKSCRRFMDFKHAIVRRTKRTMARNLYSTPFGAVAGCSRRLPSSRFDIEGFIPFASLSALLGKGITLPSLGVDKGLRTLLLSILERSFTNFARFSFQVNRVSLIIFTSSFPSLTVGDDADLAISTSTSSTRLERIELNMQF